MTPIQAKNVLRALTILSQQDSVLGQRVRHALETQESVQLWPEEAAELETICAKKGIDLNALVSPVIWAPSTMEGIQTLIKEERERAENNNPMRAEERREHMQKLGALLRNDPVPAAVLERSEQGTLGITISQLSSLAGLKVAPVMAAAKEAGAAILDALSNGIDPMAKGDGSPVTAADQAADAIVKRRLQALTPDIPVVSEEDEARTAHPHRGLRWVVDPLDGTNTAIAYAKGKKDHNQFGVIIGLVDGDRPVFGVCHFPAREDAQGVTYFTGDEGKAYKQVGEGAPKVIHVSKPPFTDGTPRVAVHHHAHRRPADIAGRAYEAVPSVGAERICMVAEGKADVADLNDIPAQNRGEYAYKQWDVAGSHAVLNAAGGALIDAETQKPLTYDRADLTVAGAWAGGADNLRLLNLANLPNLSGRVR